MGRLFIYVYTYIIQAENKNYIFHLRAIIYIRVQAATRFLREGVTNRKKSHSYLPRFLLSFFFLKKERREISISSLRATASKIRQPAKLDYCIRVYDISATVHTLTRR